MPADWRWTPRFSHLALGALIITFAPASPARAFVVPDFSGVSADALAVGAGPVLRTGPRQEAFNLELTVPVLVNLLPFWGAVGLDIGERGPPVPYVEAGLAFLGAGAKLAGDGGAYLFAGIPLPIPAAGEHLFPYVTPFARFPLSGSIGVEVGLALKVLCFR